MTIREIAETLDATWLCCEGEGGRALRTAFASDMMSDVLEIGRASCRERV